MQVCDVWLFAAGSSPATFAAKRLTPLALVLALLFMPISARAESPNGWKVVSPEIQYAAKVPDGRTFTYGYANIVHVNGRQGVLFSAYKNGSLSKRWAGAERSAS